MQIQMNTKNIHDVHHSLWCRYRNMANDSDSET